MTSASLALTSHVLHQPNILSNLYINILPVLLQAAPRPGARGFTIQTVSDLFLQLLVELFQSVNFITVLQQARVEAVEAKLVASVTGLGHHGDAGAPEALQEHAADAQSSSGHASAQAAGSAGGSHPYEHTPGCGGPCRAHAAHTARPLVSSLAQEGRSASWHRHFSSNAATCP